jgi:hypothetical protein
VLWLIGGVTPGELIRYAGYEAVFVVGPGWLVLRAVAPGIRSRAWQLALGWPIGLTLEILAFSLTAAIGARDLFWAYPALIAIGAAFALRGRWANAPTPALFSGAARWTIAGLAFVAFAYIGVAYFTITPLPGSAPGVVYPGDMTFHISVAASALRGWPPGDWVVAGLPFGYHYFANIHMAAISQVSGLHLPLIVFRLYDVPLTALLVLQVALAGRLLGGRVWTGPVAVALFLLIREIDLTINDGFPFGGIGMFHLWASPSQLLGMTMFVPAVMILALLLDEGLAARAAPQIEVSRGRLWVVLALLAIGAGGAKSVILPMLIGGLVVYLAWSRYVRGRFDPTALRALALTALLMLVYYLVMYRGNSLGLRFHPPSTIREMPPLQRLQDIWPAGTLPAIGYWIVAVIGGTLMYFGAPLLGLALWLRRRRVTSLEPAAALAIALLVVGFGAFLFLYDEYLEQTYFTLFGLIAVLPLAAAGLLDFYEERLGELDWRRLAALALAWTAALVVGAFLADRLSAQGHYIQADAALYGPVALVIGGLALGALLFRGRTRLWLGALAVGAVMLAAALDSPLDVVPHTVRQLDHGAPLYTTSRAGLRPRELEGMEWIRDHLPDDAVLAVSNDRTLHTFRLGPSDSDYTAFAERRTFREAWSYTPRANEIGQRDVAAGRLNPFPKRTALERALFERADARAARIMARRYGVDYVVVSRKDGAVDPGVYRLGSLVYSNPAVDVIELSAPRRGEAGA